MALALALCATPAIAQEAGGSPALGGRNDAGALFDGRTLDGKESSVDISLGDGFGLRLGGLLDRQNYRNPADGTWFGTSGHLYWRDPSEGLFGLYSHYAQLDAPRGAELYVGGAEAAGYWDRFTVGGAAGIESGGQMVGSGPLGRLDLAGRLSFQAIDTSLSLGAILKTCLERVRFGSGELVRNLSAPRVRVAILVK